MFNFTDFFIYLNESQHKFSLKDRGQIFLLNLPIVAILHCLIVRSGMGEKIAAFGNKILWLHSYVGIL